MDKKGNSRIKNKKSLAISFFALKRFCSGVHLSTWYFSVIFFVAIFFVSLWVWWASFYSPKPSRETILKFESSKENFEAMKSKTESAVETLKERRNNFLSTPDFSSQRDLFVNQRAIDEAEEKAQKEAAASDAVLQEQVPDSSPMQ